MLRQCHETDWQARTMKSSVTETEGFGEIDVVDAVSPMLLRDLATRASVLPLAIDLRTSSAYMLPYRPASGAANGCA